jgi:hypothetical protein
MPGHGTNVDDRAFHALSQHVERPLHLLLESAVYDGIKGELELQFYPLGISRLAAEAAMVGQASREAA